MRFSIKTQTINKYSFLCMVVFLLIINKLG